MQERNLWYSVFYLFLWQKQPRKQMFFEFDFLLSLMSELPPLPKKKKKKSTHEYGVAGPWWGRQAGISSLCGETSDEVPCGGSGVDSGGHHYASLPHKPGTFVFGEKPCKIHCFHPAKAEDGFILWSPCTEQGEECLYFPPFACSVVVMQRHGDNSLFLLCTNLSLIQQL